MRPWIIAAAVVAALLITAQADDETHFPSILSCAPEAGCRHLAASGKLSDEVLGMALGMPQDEDAVQVICEGIDCSWSVLTEIEADRQFGGSGRPDGVAHDDLSEDTIIPEAGDWWSLQGAGVVRCGEGFTVDIPASEPEPSTILLGDEDYVINSSSTEIPIVKMQRMGPANFEALVPVQTPAGEFEMLFEAVFFDPMLAYGQVSGEVRVLGLTCEVERRFHSYHQDFSDDAGTDAVLPDGPG